MSKEGSIMTLQFKVLIFSLLTMLLKFLCNQNVCRGHSKSCRYLNILKEVLLF